MKEFIKRLTSLFGKKEIEQNHITQIDLPNEDKKDCNSQTIKERHPMRSLHRGGGLYEELCFSHDTMVIGVGGSGKSILDRMLLNSPDDLSEVNADYVLIGFDWGIRDSAVENQIMLNIPTACGTTLEYDTRGHYESEFYDDLVSKFGDNLRPIIDYKPQKVVIVVGLGGSSGYGAYSIIKELQKHDISVTAIVSMPFRFEGGEKAARAKESLIKIRSLAPNTIVYYRDSIENDKSIMKTLNQVDMEIAELIKKTLEDFVIENNENNVSDSLQPQEEYGQVQTLCDIIKVLNERNHYASVDDIMKDMAEVMARYVKRGTIGEATRRHVNAGLLENGDLFKDGRLDFEALRTLLLEKINSPENTIERVWDRRDVAKFINLVSYVNEFRRYTSANQIREDFVRYVFDGLTSCGDFSESRLNDRMFHGFPLGGHAYPYHAFFWALNELWTEVSTDGILDNAKLQAKMIDEYQRDKAELGLEKVVAEHYVQDSACHPEVFVPKNDYYGPVLVSDSEGRRFVESCGEGKGPNRSADLYEFSIVQEILNTDPKYTKIEDYYIPKQDFTLPVFGWMGKINFHSEDEKVSFIKQQLKRK